MVGWSILGRGCFKWLLWLLLTLLIIGLLLFLLRSCEGCSGHHEENGVVPIDSVTTSNGRVIDDNGRIRPITGDDGKLPDQGSVVAPVTGEMEKKSQLFVNQVCQIR